MLTFERLATLMQAFGQTLLAPDDFLCSLKKILPQFTVFSEETLAVILIFFIFTFAASLRKLNRKMRQEMQALDDEIKSYQKVMTQQKKSNVTAT